MQGTNRSSHRVAVGKKSSYHWVNRQGNTEHEVIISARDINESLPGITVQCWWPGKTTVGAWRRVAKPSPGEHLSSRERPKEPSLFISSEMMLSGYLITALKHLSRERLKLDSYLI